LRISGNHDPPLYDPNTALPYDHVMI